MFSDRSLIDRTMQHMFGLKKTRYALLVGLIAAMLLLDRLVKWWTLANLTPRGNPGFDPIPGILRFVYVENRGVAFGFLAHNTLLLGVAATCVILGMMWKARHWFQDADLVAQIAVALIVAGGFGNIYDRFAYGFVVDMIHLIPLPIFQVFNIADMAISFGAVFLFIMMWREDAAKRKATSTPSEAA